jgi:DNA-directed RNA polymerase specialized sigma24 family protein
MAWQDTFAGSTPRINAEYEQELHLADQARMGADWALGALIARYQPTVSRYLTRLTGSSTRARLLSEQIFIRMERRLHGPHGGQHLRLWLLRASTEAGLDELRKPHHTMPRVQLESSSPSHPRALLPEVPDTQSNEDEPASSPQHQTDTGKKIGASGRRGTTRRQLRQLIWSAQSDSTTASEDDETSFPAGAATDTQYRKQAARGRRGSEASSGRSRGQLWDGTDEESEVPVDEEDILEPREVLRYRMIRAVLAELPYGDAQCLALHLIANLNQAEVSRALGITASATRKRIVSGLQLFAQRYEAASASLGISLDALEGGRRTEVMEDVEVVEEDLFALPGQRDEATPSLPPLPSVPSHREPIVVSAAVTNPLPAPEDVGAGDEAVVVWDLPPFDDIVNIETQPLPNIVDAASEPAEPSTAQEEAGAAAFDDEVTRRLVWSRPAAYRQTPVTPGDEVTTRLDKPRRRSAATVGPASSASSSSSTSSAAAAAAGNSGGRAAAEDKVVEEEWTYTEQLETISEPPPEELVVDAGPPVVVVTRTVPILTTCDEAPDHAGTDHDNSPGATLDSSRSIAGDEARVISVLTPTGGAASSGDMRLDSNGSSGSGSDDQYRHSSAFS